MFFKKLHSKWLWRKANVPDPQILVQLIDIILRKNPNFDCVITTIKVNKNGTIDLMLRKDKYGN